MSTQDFPPTGTVGPEDTADKEALAVDECVWGSRFQVPEEITEGEVYTRHHPHSGVASGLNSQPRPKSPPVSSQPSPNTSPFAPFTNFWDFDQARLLINRNASDGEIDDQLEHNARKAEAQGVEPSVIRSAKDHHAILARAVSAENLEDIETEFKSHTYSHRVRARSPWLAMKELVQHPDLAPHLVFMPSQPFVRSRTTGTPVQVWEESWHSQDRWEAQIYADATHLTTIGNLEVWSVYLWIGNVPASIRKQREIGGGALIGYLPFVQNKHGLSSTAIAELRAHVYQQAFEFILETVKSAIKYGRLI
ncbi:hypothetical protein FRC09_020403 [Ceratobasidium sp. 395]|nr:hypothetical protein FRC09_020403 [Ceratobasidium sp. 395]